jgi:hypothetical protein
MYTLLLWYIVAVPWPVAVVLRAVHCTLHSCRCLLCRTIVTLQLLKSRIPGWSALPGADDNPPVLKLNASAPSTQYDPSEAAMQELREYYKPYNAKLAKMTGVAF